MCDEYQYEKYNNIKFKLLNIFIKPRIDNYIIYQTKNINDIEKYKLRFIQVWVKACRNFEFIKNISIKIYYLIKSPH